jgi:hypothetical protein
MAFKKTGKRSLGAGPGRQESGFTLIEMMPGLAQTASTLIETAGFIYVGVDR